MVRESGIDDGGVDQLVVRICRKFRRGCVAVGRFRSLGPNRIGSGSFRVFMVTLLGIVRARAGFRQWLIEWQRLSARSQDAGGMEAVFAIVAFDARGPPDARTDAKFGAAVRANRRFGHGTTCQRSSALQFTVPRSQAADKMLLALAE
jgi:hypothetical protein